MSLHTLSMPDMVIPNGATESNVLTASGLAAGEMVSSGDGYRDAESITFFAPDTLPETVTLYTADVPGGNFNPLQRAGADVTFPAGKSITVDSLSFKAMKLVAGGAVGAIRTFKLNKSVWI